MRLLILVSLCDSMLLLSSATFKFNETESEVLRDGERIRGIRNRENKTFVLGGLFPVHFRSTDSQSDLCGEVSEGNVERVEAMLYAIDRINADRDLLPGIDIGYDIRDTCFSETLGLDEALDLIITGSNLSIGSCNAGIQGGLMPGAASAFAPISGIIGAAASRVSIPVASLCRLFRMPQISFGSTSPFLSDRTRYTFFRRTIPSDDLQVLAMVEILHRFGWNFVSILHSEDAYGSAGASEFVNVSTTRGICIDLRKGIRLSSTDTDYDNLVRDLANSRANVIIFFAIQETVKNVLTRVNDSESLRKRFLWIASDGWAHAINLLRDFNETVVGLFSVAPFSAPIPDFHDYISQLTINSNNRNNWFPEFFAAFANCTVEKDCDNNTDISAFPHYHQHKFIPIALVVDAVYAFAHALHDFLADNCRSTESAPFEWSRESATCWGQTRELNGTSLLEYLDKVNFLSIANKTIMFDEFGSVQAVYEILNYQATISEENVTEYQFVSVGTWVNSNISEPLTLKENVQLQFGVYDNGTVATQPKDSKCGACRPGTYIRNIFESCCNICEPCLGKNFSSGSYAEECSSCLVEGEREMWGNNPFTGSNSCVLIPETSAMYGDPWAIPSLILGCVGLLCVASTSVVFAIYWKNPIVKSSGREEMILLLVGLSSSFVLPFFYVAPPSIPICLVNRLGIWFCYSLMFGALAIKVQRVARIFYGVKRNLHYTPRFATPIYQIIFTMIIVAIQMLLNVSSVVFVPPDMLRILRYDQDSEGRLGLPEVIIVCRKEATPVVVLSLLYETCIITVATILGIFSFKFPKNFNEAKYISFCTFSLLVVWLGLIPAYFTTESQPEIQNAAVSLFIILSAYGVLCFIFGPKLFILFLQNNPSATKQSSSHDGKIKIERVTKELENLHTRDQIS